MRRLSGLDAAFLYAETPAMHLHGGALVIVDPATSAGRHLDVDRYREVIAARLDRLDPFRLRLAAAPFGVDRPVWVDDRHVDVRQHIRAVAVPRPGTPRQVSELVSQMLAVPLPRDRPLWEMWFVEGLEHGHVGIICKVHHALLGGTQAIRMFELLYDAAADAADGPGTEGPHEQALSERPPARLQVAAHAALTLAATPLRVGRSAGDGVRAGARIAGAALSGQRDASVLPFQGPRSSLNGSLVAARSSAYVSIPLPDVKTVKDAVGVTVNDVVLAVCAGALRTYLTDRGELPDKALTASVQAAVGGIADSVLGNATSMIGATLATDVTDPVERLQRINASTRVAKAMHQALGAEMILHLADMVPPGVMGAAMRTWSATGMASRMIPPFNVIASNLRGPEVPLHSGGARVLACHVFGPPIEALSLNITVLSYCGSIDVGILASPNLVPDPWPIADAMPGALAELVAAVR
jgi:WS/DGAT/MGAT family acyltransferase